MTALLVPPRQPGRAASTGPGRMFVLLGGVPGAGKTTLLRRLAGEGQGFGSVDTEWFRNRLSSLLPGWVPYRWYRPVVHTVCAMQTAVLLLRGPARSSRPLVVHDPATRPLRRRLTGELARRRGWVPVLVVLDVSCRDALAGQRRRGRMVPKRSFARHWLRWEQQRPRLVAADQRRAADGPWRRVYVVDRSGAPRVLSRLLAHSARSRPAMSAAASVAATPTSVAGAGPVQSPYPTR